MAPVAGMPFLHYVIKYCEEQGIGKFIFSLGYKHELIADWLSGRLPGGSYSLSIEEEPLGTGGAIRKACGQAGIDTVFVLNGDTYFGADLGELSKFHKAVAADCTLCLKPMKNFERYGVVEINKDGSILDFREKQHYEQGLINGGVYALSAPAFLREALDEKFSFEKDYLESYCGKRAFYGLKQEAYFIDIGIPEDYERAQREMRGLQ
jgi:D-glycero-alpha-D-manno-heptose 1-phosphate guanylyltransferase